MKRSLRVILILALITACASPKKQPACVIGNPLMDGYFADPCIVKEGDTFYIYATIDPWGGEELAVFSTTDFSHFTRHHLSWPTKQQCTSASSNNSMVWAPSVRKAPNGKYYMYVSVGSEIWVGISDSPLGPWENGKSDNTPLIAAGDFPKVHNIDADCFIDDDGQAYLYWGSGFHWVNGICMAVKLYPDMVSFSGEPLDVTPDHYFEAPNMIKRFGKYYLMFSDGKAIDATYKIGYAVGDNPLGPFYDGASSPILETTADSITVGPGHHAVFSENGQDYLLYHRIFPQEEKYVLRQLCIDSLNFDEKHNIRKVNPQGVVGFLE
ncbi:family 43 glycosylhydrolase [Marinilabilia sp.]|uniref:family 43 glycosylhydrolase n=1 Tax=Marinilabilia sp. TaxID=2021252 RepID=UPI0025C30477|nr:family 43 glycosylhydrolase [Marinilabilia sp.]